MLAEIKTLQDVNARNVGRPENVTIIGGGLSGPCLALCLKKLHGITSTIYELRSEDYSAGVNIALAPNALRVLQHIGVLDEIRTLGHSYEQMAITSARSGNQIGWFYNGSQKHYNYESLRIHRRTVQLVLLKECKSQGIPIHYNRKVEGILEESDSSVKVRFEDGEVVETDTVIAADGLWSRVRDHIVKRELPYSGSMGIIIMHVDRDKLDESAKRTQFPTFCFGQSGMIAVFPSNPYGGDVDMFSTMPYPCRSREEWEALEASGEAKRKIMTEKFGKGWPRYISKVWEEEAADKMWLSPFFEAPPFEHWTSSKGRVIIVGDAAHAFSPQGGQGAAMALEDGETLAHTIAHADFSTDRMSLLGKWERHRQARLRLVKEMTDWSGMQRAPVSSSVAYYLKEWIMWAVLKIKGPTMGMGWLYSYNPEDMASVLRS